MYVYILVAEFLYFIKTNLNMWDTYSSVGRKGYTLIEVNIMTKIIKFLPHDQYLSLKSFNSSLFKVIDLPLKTPGDVFILAFFALWAEWGKWKPSLSEATIGRDLSIHKSIIYGFWFWEFKRIKKRCLLRFIIFYLCVRFGWA